MMNRDLLKVIIVSLLAVSITIFDEYADPFGLTSTTDRLSSSTFSAMLSPFYGGTDGSIRRARDNIIVILFDDQYLEAKKQTWPLSMRTHRQIMERIAAAGADSIFLDIYFNADSEKKENQVATLIQDVNDIEQDYGVPVWFAGLKNDPIPQYANIRPNHVALAEMAVEEHQYALTQSTHHGQQPTAAYALYNQWCQQHECYGNLTPLEKETLFIQWGYAPSRIMSSYYANRGVECQQQPTGVLWTFFESLQLLGLKAVNGLTGKWQASCLYHDHINALLLENMSTAQLQTLVEDKIVLIGGHTALQPDLKRSAVHGLVPGIFWHAAALDNLMMYGDQFLREAPEGDGNLFSILSTTVIIGFYGLVSCVLIRVNHLPGPPLGSHRQALIDNHLNTLNLQFGLLALALMGLLLGYTFFFTHWAPSNWLGVALILAIINSDPLKAIAEFSVEKRPLWNWITRYCRGLCQCQKAKRRLAHRLVEGIYFSIKTALLFFVLVLGAYLLLFLLLLVTLLVPADAPRWLPILTIVYCLSIAALSGWTIQNYKQLRQIRAPREPRVEEGITYASENHHHDRCNICGCTDGTVPHCGSG